MEKYYFKTRGEEPDIICIEKCQSKFRPTDGTMIGSILCQECKNCKETDIDEFGNVTWIKCSDIENAKKESN